MRLDPWVRKIPGEGNGNPLQYCCLKNPLEPDGLQNPWACKELDTTK